MMLTRERILWGMTAGAVIVLVKILRPDGELVFSFFENFDGPQVAYYVFIAGVTIARSGSFSL